MKEVKSTINEPDDVSNVDDGAHVEAKKIDEDGDLIKGTWFGTRLWYNYDHNMLISLFLQYFN